MATDAATGSDPVGRTSIDASGAALIPTWVRRMAAIGWRLLAAMGLAAAIAAIARWLSTDTAAIVVGAIVASTVAPSVGFLRRRGWDRTRAAAVTSVLSLLTVLLVALLIILAFVPYFSEVIRVAQEGLTGLVQRLADLGTPPEILDLVRSVVAGIQTWLTTGVNDLVGPLGTLVTVLVLGGFLAFYLLQDADRAWAKATGGLDPWQTDALTSRALVAVAEVGGFLRGTTISAAVDAVTQFAFLLLLGVPLAGPLAVLVFIAGFIPYLGAIFTTAVVVLVTFATQGLNAAIVLLGLIVVATVVLDWLLERFVYGRSVRVHPALVLIVVPAGAALFGVGGIFVAVPVVAAAIAFAPAITQVLGPGPDGPPAGSFSPLWLDRLGQFSWRALVILAALAVAVQVLVVPFLSAPVVIALVIACAMKPATDVLRARGLHPTAAAVLISVVSGLIVAAILTVTVVSVVTQLPAILDRAGDALGQLGLGGALRDVIGPIRESVLAGGSGLVRNVATVFVALATASLLTFFFLRDGPVWWNRALDRVPSRRRATIGSAGAQAARILNGSTLGTGIVSAFAGLAQTAIMLILGLPLAFPIGVLTFFGGFIPYVGSFISTGLAFLVAVAVGDTVDVVAMAIFTIVMNVLLANVIAPLVYGKTVSLHPAIVLLAAPAGAAIGGLIGMFLIVPLIAIVVATWRPMLRLFETDEDVAIAPARPTPVRPAVTATPAPEPTG
jgi:putative heme transporter